jgi:acyl-CoA synthetase (AMP-forming)/AMP-acid ligase II
MIVVRGENFFAEDIERIVETVPEVRSGCCAAVALTTRSTEEIAVIAETKLESATDQERCRRAIRDVVWQDTGVVPRKILLVLPGSLPKTSSGKLQRSRALSLIEAQDPAAGGVQS